MASEHDTLVWLITGATSGLGRSLALEALSRSEKVIATGRAKSFSQLDDLKSKGAEVLELDVTASLGTLQGIAEKAVAIYGRIDVLVNNAGYVLSGVFEETTPQATQDIFNTNVFGAMNVARAFLPHMRAKKTGTILWIGSIGGLRGYASGGSYSMTKWTLRGLSLSLHDEISALGLRSICLNFGIFRTSVFEAHRRVTTRSTIKDYKEIADGMEDFLQGFNGVQPGDPVKGARVVVDVVRGEGEAKGKPFPSELILGTDCYDTARAELLRNLELLEAWKDVSQSTDF